MSSDEEDQQQQQQEEEKPFAVERAKTGRAKCKKCKCPIEKGEIRIAKYVTSFFSDGKLMPAWHHVTCLFDVFAKQRATTKKIDNPAKDVKDWEQLSDDDKKIILDKLEAFEKSCNYSILREVISFVRIIFIYSVTDLFMFSRKILLSIKFFKIIFAIYFLTTNLLNLKSGFLLGKVDYRS